MVGWLLGWCLGRLPGAWGVCLAPGCRPGAWLRVALAAWLLWLAVGGVWWGFCGVFGGWRVFWVVGGFAVLSVGRVRGEKFSFTY